ncbi:MAG: FAD-binding protein, partial [Spirochaetota bacterium]
MKKSLTEFYKALRAQGFAIFGDVPLAPFTAFAVGGNAELLLLPRTCAELWLALEQAERWELPLTIFGGGANILVADSGIRGAVLSLRSMQGAAWQSGLLRAEAGWDMSALCRYSAQKNASGLHYFYGMPGSLGGAVYMNARCYEGEMSEIVRRVRCIPARRQVNGAGVYCLGDLRWVDLSPEDWHYKYSHFQRDSGHELAGALIVSV